MNHASGMIVIGLVTGTHFIEDIKIAVPHKVAVAITAQQMLHSKDLWRALNQGAIFKLDGGALHPTNTAPSRGSSGEITTLRQENKKLKRLLAEAQMKNDGLQQALMGLNTQLDGILGAVGRLGGPQQQQQQTVPAQVELPADMMQLLQQILAQGGGGVAVAALPQSDVVGGDAPAFIPDIKPTDAQASIQVKKTTEEGSSVSSAASKLKEMRKQGAG